MTDEHLLSTIAQTHLAAGGFYRHAIDGDWGVWSRDAARRWWDAAGIGVISRMPRMAWEFMGTPDANERRILAAQCLLKDKGIYGGAIDAMWGPISRSAARAWAAVIHPPVYSDQPGRTLDPYGVAKRYIGVREIPGKNHCGVILAWYRRLQIAIYNDEVAWCSTFANFCADEAGFERTGSLAARSWLNCGEKIELKDARIGRDVLIFERGTSGWEGHVTFFAGHVRGGYYVRGLGGNQNDEVNISNYATAKLLGVRRLRSLDQLQGGSNKI